MASNSIFGDDRVIAWARVNFSQRRQVHTRPKRNACLSAALAHRPSLRRSIGRKEIELKTNSRTGRADVSSLFQTPTRRRRHQTSRYWSKWITRKDPYVAAGMNPMDLTRGIAGCRCSD